MDLKFTYPDPLLEHSARKSQAWYEIFCSYMNYRNDVFAENGFVALPKIICNLDDGGRPRWETSKFRTEVQVLVRAIRDSGTFAAILVQKRDDGMYLVLDGHHRLAAWPQLSDSWLVPAVVVTVSTRVPTF